MATLFLRKGVWYTRFRNDGKDIWRSTGEKTKHKATLRLARILQEHHAAVTINRLTDQLIECLSELPADLQKEERKRILSVLSTGTRTPMSLPQIWKKWATLPGVKDRSTFGEDESRWKKFTVWIEGRFGDDFEIGHLTRATAQDYISELSASGITRHTINVHMLMLRKVLQETTEHTGLVLNPFGAIKLPAQVKSAPARRALTDEEISLILNKLDPGVVEVRCRKNARVMNRKHEWYGATLVGAYCGLRLMDSVLLNRKDLTEDFDVLVIIPHKNSRYGEKARLIVPVHPVLQEYLRNAEPDRDGYFFPQIRQRYLNRGSDVSRDFIRHLKSLGLQTTEPDDTKGRKRSRNILGFHSLRYSFATIQRAKGVDPHIVSQMAGHTTISMTNIYTSVDLEQKKISIKLLPDFTGKSS